jgi:hypothetical protein
VQSGRDEQTIVSKPSVRTCQKNHTLIWISMSAENKRGMIIKHYPEYKRIKMVELRENPKLEQAIIHSESQFHGEYELTLKPGVKRPKDNLKNRRSKLNHFRYRVRLAVMYFGTVTLADCSRSGPRGRTFELKAMERMREYWM